MNKIKTSTFVEFSSRALVSLPSLWLLRLAMYRRRS